MQLRESGKARVGDVVVDELRNPRVADLGLIGDGLPITPVEFEQRTHVGVEGIAHIPHTIAKYCYDCKQHFASPSGDTAEMREPINQTLAKNLRHFMDDQQLTQSALARKCGMGQTTIGLYLAPERREPGKSGKPRAS